MSVFSAPSSLHTWRRWLAGSALLFACVGWLLWYLREVPLLSPLTEHPTFHFFTSEPPASEGKVVYGYLPYWNLQKTDLQPELTHLAYFGITIDGAGNAVTILDGATEPGYARLDSETLLDQAATVRNRGGSLEVVLVQFNNDDIRSLLSQPAAHQRLLTTIDSLLLAYPVSGINIDIEYSGEVTPALRQNMTSLVRTIRNHLNQKYAGVTLSIAMYASAATHPQIWEVAELQEQVDYIVVMAYDFHRRSSPQAGPVAPLFGGKELWDSDITQHLNSFLAVTPREKMLLGVPFYGYEWQTTSRAPQAHTFPDTGATASFQRVQQLLSQRQELAVQEHWNESALSPYLSYIEDGLTYVVYYENSRSLSYKLDYVNQLDLGGIAIWALGYEGSSRELWDVIGRKL